MSKKWAYVTQEYTNVTCLRRTRIGAWWHGLTSHLHHHGRVITSGKFYEDRLSRFASEKGVSLEWLLGKEA